ncbi:unnamed protein product [Rotaria sp. Silwood2]|nr:unnamed protein product [Rotaria sp. Silwood2]
MSLMPSDEVSLLNDGRYKNFIATLERVLKQFEYSSEWADLITNLVKVKKAIESYPKFLSIPKRITLSKRLAQCLHPALPSGVHLKTLEVYETIFRMIGKRNLQRDIILYSCGLFPLLPAAALPVKPVLLTLYETYFLPLDDALNPILTGFLLGLFPALEEGADYYDRIYALLDNLSNRIDKFYFYTCIWSAIHLVASARHSALTFILNHFDKRKTMEDQLYLMGSSVETMVSAVCTCLQDREQSLVQRSILDFLLICLPMHNKQLTKIDIMKIITVALHVLLKRDMSLNRRIYAWFLGTEQLPIDNRNQQQHISEIHSSTTSLTITNDPFNSSSYFVQYTKENLIQSILHALERISSNTLSTTGKSKPTTPDENIALVTSIAESMPLAWTLIKLIRVLIILVDKPDVGPNILESVLMSYLLIVYQQIYLPAKQLTSINVQQENHRSETLKTLNMLLDTFEPYFIWEFLTKSFDIIITEQQDQIIITVGTTIEQLCGIINMLLDIASLDSSTDIQSEHLPEMLYHLIKTMNNNIHKFTADQITLCVEVLLKILKKVVPTNTTHRLSIFHRSTSDDILSLTEQNQPIDNIFDENLTDTLFQSRNHSEIDFINLITKTNQINSTTNPLRYIDNQPIVNQSLFLSSILQYLKQIDFIENHRHIISLVVRILPHCGSSLKSISSLVIEQICRNLCFVVQTYHQQQQGNKIRFKQLPYFDVFEYIIHLIQRLSYICNYCLLGNAVDNGQFSNQTLSPQHWMKILTINERDLSDARQSILNQLPSILSSIIFIWKTISEQYTFDNTNDQIISNIGPIHPSTNIIWPLYSVKQIRQTILDFLSSLTKPNGVSFLSAVAQCWGERKRQQRTQQKSSTQSTLDTSSRTTILTMPRDNIGEAQALIDIVMNINGYTLIDMIPNMNELIRNQLTARDKKKQNYDAWCLQFLLAYLQHQKNLSVDCWPTLAFMFKECLSQSISPPATFLIIRILSFYIKQSPSLVERRDLKDLQDITMRVLDNCNTIVASSLEQTTWLRKNLQVRVAQPDIQSSKSSSTGNQTTSTGSGSSHETGNIPVDDTADFDARNALLTVVNMFDKFSAKIVPQTVFNIALRGVTQTNNTGDLINNGNFSYLALSVLAEHAAALLDIVYNRTDEKDRVVLPFLQNLVTNVMPYVRTHVSANAPSYRSASALLMNISQYSYTRKAWKKEAFEQLFDVAFFQLDIIALRSWKIIVDNMITNERPTSFRDVMTKINTVQTGLFVSKEHEYEQRAMLVKRFAFVIYASEKDQYNRQLPEILERIADLLKLPQVPILHTQMFLFLRVLLLRISTKNLISLWPILMTELIQVLLQLEQDLISDLDGEVKSHVQRMVTNDLATTNVSSSSNASNPALKMYLYACKLLDVLLAMPYSELYHFQLFRSAFVTDEYINDRKSPIDTFIAFSIRLSKLLERKLQLMSTSIHERLPIITNTNRPLLRLRTITNIIELYSFFNCLTQMHTYDHHHYQHSLPTHTNISNKQISIPKKKESSKKKNKSLQHISSYRKSDSTTMNSIKEETMSEIETSVLEDFVESWI